VREADVKEILGDVYRIQSELYLSIQRQLRNELPATPTQQRVYMVSRLLKIVNDCLDNRVPERHDVAAALTQLLVFAATSGCAGFITEEYEKKHPPLYYVADMINGKMLVWDGPTPNLDALLSGRGNLASFIVRASGEEKRSIYAWSDIKNEWVKL
jgi:hypothetical protein